MSKLAIDGSQALIGRLRGALHAEPLLRSSAIHISALGGLVRLTGTVDTPEQRDIALRLAGETPGVLRTCELLVVRPSRPRSPALSAEGPPLLRALRAPRGDPQ